MDYTDYTDNHWCCLTPALQASLTLNRLRRDILQNYNKITQLSFYHLAFSLRFALSDRWFPEGADFQFCKVKAGLFKPLRTSRTLRTISRTG